MFIFVPVFLGLFLITNLQLTAFLGKLTGQSDSVATDLSLIYKNVLDTDIPTSLHQVRLS